LEVSLCPSRNIKAEAAAHRGITINQHFIAQMLSASNEDGG
jgi:hypothetical protein